MRAFLYNNEEGVEVLVKTINDSVTWWDLTEHYFQYLQASGYQLTRKDFAVAVTEGFL